MSKTTDDYKVSYRAGVLEYKRALGGSYHMGIDPAIPQGDYGCVTVWKAASRLRKLLRRTGLDSSTWEYEIVTQEFIK